jgi:hypothetical protein
MRLFVLALSALAACGPRLAVPVEGHGAVSLQSAAVAVVSRSVPCQRTASDLVDALWEAGLEVDPHAPVRLEVVVCGADLEVGVEEVAGAEQIDRRTVARARAHALVAVGTPNGVQAHLLGTGRHQAHRDGRGLAVWQRDATRHARRDAATDLVQQLSPTPLSVDRRVYPNAPHGSARELTTLAVLAEQRGDLDEALVWATAAHDQRPTPRTARYQVDLRRRMSPE